jgi:predicted RNA binding protein YcfA (HicA-like mRNA interferase family)
MAGRLPVLSGRDAVRVFGQFGWVMVRQSGSHTILVKGGEDVTLSVPDHREVAK